MKSTLARTVTALLAFAAVSVGIFAASGSAVASVNDAEPAGTLSGPVAPTWDLDLPGGEGDQDGIDEDGINKLLDGTESRTTNRWFEASNGFFTKYDGFVGTQILEQADRLMSGGMAMRSGNMFVGLANDFTRFTVGLDFVDKIGATIDKVVAVILRTLFGENAEGAPLLLGFLIVISVVLVIGRNFRRGGAVIARQLFALALTFGLVFAIGSQALNQPKDSVTDDYNPAVLTPGWAVQSITDGVSWLTNEPVKAFIDNPVVSSLEGEGGVGFGYRPDAAGPYPYGGAISCAAMVLAMEQDQDDIRDKADGNANSSSIVSATRLMDQMWNSSGLYTWAKTQGGYNNPYIDNMYCRILDQRSDLTPRQKAVSTAMGAIAFDAARHEAGDGAATSGWTGLLYEAFTPGLAGSIARWAPMDKEVEMANYVAWAACEPTGVDAGVPSWKWADGWIGYHGGHEVWGSAPRGVAFNADDSGSGSAPKECGDWWAATTDEGGVQTVPAIFTVKGEAGWIDDRASDASDEEAVTDFLRSITGTQMGAGAGLMAYAVGGFFFFLAFGVINIVLLVAKIGLVFFVLSLYGVLFGSMWAPAAMKDRLLKTFNKLLGMAVFTSLAALIIAFIVMFTQMLIGLANSVLGAGSVGAMVWVGVAPIIALLLVHLMFTKVFKLPSPVSIRGGMAWNKSGLTGAMGGAIGTGAAAAAGTAIGSSRLVSALRNTASNVGRNAMRSGVNKITGNGAAGKAGRGMADALAKGTKGESNAPATDAANIESTPASDAPKTRKDLRMEQRQVKRQDSADLKEARADHIVETGKAAPGDWGGAVKVATGAAVGAAGAKIAGKVGEMGGALKGKVLANPLVMEMRSRKAARDEALEAKKLEGEQQRAKRHGVTDEDSAAVTMTDAMNTRYGSEEAAEHRAALGADPQAGEAVSGTADMLAGRRNLDGLEEVEPSREAVEGAHGIAADVETAAAENPVEQVVPVDAMGVLPSTPAQSHAEVAGDSEAQFDSTLGELKGDLPMPRVTPSDAPAAPLPAPEQVDVDLRPTLTDAGTEVLPGAVPSAAPAVAPAQPARSSVTADVKVPVKTYIAPAGTTADVSPILSGYTPKSIPLDMPRGADNRGPSTVQAPQVERAKREAAADAARSATDADVDAIENAQRTQRKTFTQRTASVLSAPAAAVHSAKLAGHTIADRADAVFQSNQAKTIQTQARVAREQIANSDVGRGATVAGAGTAKVTRAVVNRRKNNDALREAFRAKRAEQASALDGTSGASAAEALNAGGSTGEGTVPTVSQSRNDAGVLNERNSPVGPEDIGDGATP